MTRRKAMEFTLIQMEDHIKDIGKMENNMARVYLSLHKVLKDKESGTRANASNGLMKMSKNKRWKYEELN